MHTEPLDQLPLWALFMAPCIVAWLVMEVGYRFGQWRHARTADEKEASVGAMVGSILGLLAFMLAFTFGMAASRFDARRQTVLEEANAIGTTFLRARLLPEPQQAESARLLREYVDVRLRGILEGRVEEAMARSVEIQDQLWSMAVAASQNVKGNTVMTSLFVQALNGMNDIHAKRVQVGIRNRVPLSIWIGLSSLALLSMTAMGYHAGLSGTRRSPAMFGTVLAFGGVLFLIADLDRGQEGFLTVSQQALVDLQRSMAAGK